MKEKENYICKRCKNWVHLVGEKEGQDVYNCKYCHEFLTKDQLKYKKRK